MIVHDQELTIEPLILGFVNLYKATGTINSVEIGRRHVERIHQHRIAKHAPFGSSPKTHYTEIDPIAGISIGFAKHFTWTSLIRPSWSRS